MKSIKCPQCGLVYWATDPNCKRCGLATADSSVDAPVHEAQFQTQNVSQPPANGAENPAIAQMLKNIKTDAIFFYVIGGLQILLWFVLGNLLIVDGVLNIGLSFLIHKFRSRVAAVFLLGLTVLTMISALMMMFTSGVNVGVLFPIMLLLRFAASLRMVQSTFKLSGYVEEVPLRPLPPPPPNFHPDTAPQWSEPAGATQWQQT